MMTVISAAWTAAKSWIGDYTWVLYVLGAAAFAWGVWTVDDWRWSARMADLKLEWQQARDKAVAEATAAHLAQERAFYEADVKRTGELNDAKAEIDALRADVAAGRKRLLVHARCPTPAGVPQAGGDAGLGDAASPRLEGAAEQDYYTLRGALELMEKQLLFCQDAVRAERGM